ncbi:aldehyde dehydrogenase family protein, partial [candidate division KSB1 bacterium]|nr:aldehyde dehydrogenase family protein [candidate division KSB1 bacterium]NIR68658.1 aldehyde dehydrogenase family protein [candidate division KSB1 bacterium]NIS27147.1 aldehyde dehydrogenase family protein [candidate division KSB1 bacterium]NIT74033.1 aldehyde dehydrogenase family protein [candidate division KSB1 bacterium]NIU27899.1 aldehyde dehydrogenase family protein [candidate division KSB1 bacterium]
KVERLVRDALNKGAVIKLGGQSRKDLGDWYFEPTILTNVNSSMELSHQEIFGPVIALTPFITDDEAVYMANDSNFGLSASIWTENRKQGLKLAGRIQAGSVLVNDLQIHIAQTEAPYSGYKHSGLGVSHGPWGVMELVRYKYINSDRTGLSKILKTISKPLVNNDIWWFKYNKNLTDSFRVFAHFLHGDTLLKRVKSAPSVLKAIFRKDYL